MIIIKNKYEDFTIFIPKSKSLSKAPNIKQFKITENGTYEVSGRYNINVDVEGGGCDSEELLEEIEQLEAEVDRLEDENTALSTENDALENELEQAGKDNENLRSEITTLENSIEVLQGEKSALEAEKKALEEELAASASNIEELNNQIDYLNNEIAILNDRINTLTNEKSSLQSRLNYVQEEYDNLKNAAYYTRFPDDWAKEHSDIIISSLENFFYSPDDTKEKRVVINCGNLYDENSTTLSFRDCTVVDQNGRTLRSGSNVHSNDILTFTFTGNYFSFEMDGLDWGWGNQDIYIADLDETITHIYTTQLDFNTSPKIELTDCPSDSLTIYVEPYEWNKIDYGDEIGSYIDTELPSWGQQNQITKNGRPAKLFPIFGIYSSSYNPCTSVIESFNEQISQLEEEKESLQKQIYNKDREIQTLNTEISNLNNRINSLISEKGELQNTIDNLNSEISTKQQEINNLYDQLDDLNNTINSLTEENLTLQNLNQSLQNELLTVYEEGKTDGIAQGKEDQKALLEDITITQNGSYNNENGYDVINVNVPIEERYEEGYEAGIAYQKALLVDIKVTENGRYISDNGYAQVYVNVPNEGNYNEGYEAGIAYQKTLLEDITVTENGTYNNENGYAQVNVNVPIVEYSYSEGYYDGYKEGKTEGIAQGKEDQKELLGDITITQNGLYINENGYNQVYVKVDCNDSYEEGYNQGKTDGIAQGKENQKALLEDITITQNGTYDNENGYNVINVNIPTQTTAEIKYITQAAYNALSTKENNVFYLING